MRAWIIDIRSASAFRISLGFLLIIHGVDHLRHYADFYGPTGVLPSELLPESKAIPYFPSLLTVLEQYSWGYGAFVVFGLIAYSAFTLGVMTRLATVFSLCVFSSICHRNPYLVIGGDELIGSMLLWATLLPLGARFSVDAQMNQNPTDTLGDGVSWSHLASFGSLAQISTLYFCTAWLKSGETWWNTGSALERVLGMRTYRLTGAQLLEGLPSAILPDLTYGVLALEYALPVLILSPVLQPICRRMAIAGMILLHGGIAVTTQTGLFSITMLSLIPLLLSTEDWNWFESLPRRFGLSHKSDETHSMNPTSNLKSRWAFEWIAAFLLIGFIQENWNRTFAGKEGQFSHGVISIPWRFAAAPQRWCMFAPDPPEFDPHITVVVQYQDGTSSTAWDNLMLQAGNSSNSPEEPSFLWKLLMQRATLLQSDDRRSEGEAVRNAICQFFFDRLNHEKTDSNPGSRFKYSSAESPSSIKCVEIAVTFFPTESHRHSSEHLRTILMTRHEPIGSTSDAGPIR